MKLALPALALAFTLVLGTGQQTHAADCGMPPGNPPTVPAGATANDDQIRIAIRAVQDYGTVVQNYLNCMSLRKDSFFLNMNTEQRERWNEDFNALADQLTEIETRLNEEIRIFNRR